MFLQLTRNFSDDIVKVFIMTLKSLIGVLWKNILFLTLGLLAVFILNFSSSPFVIPKVVLLVAGTGLAVIFFALSQMPGSKFNFSFGKFDLGVFLIGVSYLTSSLIKTPSQIEAFFSPGTATFVLAGVLIYFLANQLNASGKEGLKWTLVVSGVLLSVSILFTQIGLFAKIPQLPEFVKDASFNPAGGVVPSLILLSSLVPLGLGMFLRQKGLLEKAFLGVSLALIAFGLTINVTQILPGRPASPKLPSLQTSWEVAVETIKKSPVLGIGPANYLTAFNLFRPVSYNSTDLWAAKFTTARNFYLTYLAETGILGLLAFGILFSQLYRHFGHDFLLFAKKSSVIVLLGLFALFPGAAFIMVYLFALLSAFSDSEERQRAEFNIHPSFIEIPVLIGIFLVGFYGAGMVSAEVKFKQALEALTKNDAKFTYDLMRGAVAKNPGSDLYHSSLSQINMALASSVAAKKDLTDEDKNTVSQLISQAITEAKAAVTLNPQRAGNWEVLAKTYRNIMPFAQGADNFAVQTFSRAIALDPINPNLRIALGGTYFALGRLDEAIDTFKLAVLAKPDLANAHYNLATAYREKKNFDAAITEMNNVLGLVQKDSPDYKLAQTTLDDLQKQRPSSAKATEGQGNLTAPQKNQPTNIKPPIELPQEATPPASQ